MTRAQLDALEARAFELIEASPPPRQSTPSDSGEEDWWQRDLASHPSRPDQLRIGRIQTGVTYRLQVPSTPLTSHSTHFHHMCFANHRHFLSCAYCTNSANGCFKCIYWMRRPYSRWRSWKFWSGKHGSLRVPRAQLEQNRSVYWGLAPSSSFSTALNRRQ